MIGVSKNAEKERTRRTVVTGRSEGRVGDPKVREREMTGRPHLWSERAAAAGGFGGFDGFDGAVGWSIGRKRHKRSTACGCL